MQKERALGQRQLLKHFLFVSGTWLADGDFLIAAFKTHGFNLEQTHVTAPDPLEKLMGLLAVAYCWAFAAGKWLAQSKPLKIKKHGRLPVSLLRRGLDYLRPVAQQLCANISKSHITQAVKFLSCT